MCFWAAHSFQELLLGLRGCLWRSHTKLLHLWTVHSAEQKKSLPVFTPIGQSLSQGILTHIHFLGCAYMDAKWILRQLMSWQKSPEKQQKSPEARGVGCGQVLLACAWERFEGLGEQSPKQPVVLAKAAGTWLHKPKVLLLSRSKSRQVEDLEWCIN